MRTPIIVPNLIETMTTIDEGIQIQAMLNQFNYKHTAPKFEQIDALPFEVYEIIRHYTMRGFNSTYDGENGFYTFNWKNPQMSYLESINQTWASPQNIGSLGIGYNASLLYFCMTNGKDWRSISENDLYYHIKNQSLHLAAFGQSKLIYALQTTPYETFYNMYITVFEELLKENYIFEYDQSMDAILIKWGQTFNFSFFDGCNNEIELD